VSKWMPDGSATLGRNLLAPLRQQRFQFHIFGRPLLVDHGAFMRPVDIGDIPAQPLSNSSKCQSPVRERVSLRAGS